MQHAYNLYSYTVVQFHNNNYEIFIRFLQYYDTVGIIHMCNIYVCILYSGLYIDTITFYDFDNKKKFKQKNSFKHFWRKLFIHFCFDV